MPTRTINLTEHFDRFIDDEVGSGRYGSASEVVREGSRLIERRKQADRAKRQWLRGAVRERLGEPIGFAFAREDGFRGAVAEGGGEGIVALDGVEQHAGIGVGGVEAGEDIAAVRFAGTLDGIAEVLGAVAPFFVAPAGDADEGAGVGDGFALGEVAKEIGLALLAGVFVGSLREFEGFWVGGLHGFRFLSRGWGC
ncbi:MAG: type II toxin-antitoxin system ParD family antitoxin [Bryobacterales bacterium]|nr:type II toxin-antitoxin system ParD family antitoxin [Bryobacterales bacterium]